jgi:hypothetical protein
MSPLNTNFNDSSYCTIGDRWHEKLITFYYHLSSVLPTISTTSQSTNILTTLVPSILLWSLSWEIFNLTQSTDLRFMLLSIYRIIPFSHAQSVLIVIGWLVTCEIKYGSFKVLCVFVQSSEHSCCRVHYVNISRIFLIVCILLYMFKASGFQCQSHLSHFS